MTYDGKNFPQSAQGLDSFMALRLALIASRLTRICSSRLSRLSAYHFAWYSCPDGMEAPGLTGWRAKREIRTHYLVLTKDVYIQMYLQGAFGIVILMRLVSQPLDDCDTIPCVSHGRRSGRTFLRSHVWWPSPESNREPLPFEGSASASWARGLLV